jgi:hypothetical protein
MPHGVRALKGQFTSDPRSVEQQLTDNSIPEPNSGCLIWLGSFGRATRYGCRGKERAHRSAWKTWRGPIPEGMDVLHHCDVPLCINPDHLWLGTQLDNMHDMIAKGRRRPDKRGFAHPKNRLNGSQTGEILRDPRSLRVIARAYGVAQKTVWSIKKGLTYADGELAAAYWRLIRSGRFTHTELHRVKWVATFADDEAA